MRLILPYPPSSNHFHAVYRGRKITSAAGRAYFAEVTAIIQETHPKRTTITGPVSVTLTLYRPRKSGDLDNRIKPVLDALKKGGVYTDDRQVVELHVYRHDDKKCPRVVLSVTEQGAHDAE